MDANTQTIYEELTEVARSRQTVIVYLTQRDGRFTIDTCEYRLALLPSCAAVDYWRGHPSYLVCPDMWTMADGGFGYCPLWIEELLWL